MSNYYWYLKHSISFDESDGLLKFYWDPLKPLTVHYLTFTGIYGAVQFVTDVYVSQSLSSENPGTVVVVDGNCLKMTPFKFQNVPPPMCSLTLELSKPVSHVSFLGFGNGDNICVQSNDGWIFFYKSEITSPKNIMLPSLIGSIQLPDSNRFHYRQTHWAQKDVAIAISYDKKENADAVAIIYIQEGMLIRKTQYIRVSRHPLCRLQISSIGDVLVQDEEGNIFEVQIRDDSATFEVAEPFPECCSWFTSVAIEEKDKNTILYVGMTDSNKLFLNQQLLSAECTSFFVHNHHLLLTTFSHKLCLVPLNSTFEGLFQTIYH